ncbi:MAG TPA: HAMP domain-containing sensor histidine kinase [Phycisphaerae bacterium]|nr:HAMP domain-containing sensor histidine kinase [Phycisphaerae bacterium]
MPRISVLSISLAAKCRLLFGAAVVLIIASSLFVPWLRMRDLVHEQNLLVARQIGRMALVLSDAGSGNWDLKQKALENWWPTGAAKYGLRAPVPRLIRLTDPADPKPPPWADEFVRQAIDELSKDPGKQESFPLCENVEGNLLYRVVLPIRSTGGKYPAATLLGVVAVDYPAPDARVALLYNFVLSMMAGALAGILAVLVFYIITQKLILSPVRQLTRVSESVSQGDHSIRSQIATGDEFEELSRAFNAMLAHLQSSENELRTINRSLDTRMAELAERNVALFEANKLKGQFLAMVSHELRTPLTSIIGFAELLREAATSQGGRALRYAENIVSSGRMLLGLINDLLDLAKIEAGKLDLHIGHINLPDLLQNLVDFVRPLADKKSLQLVTQIPADLPAIISDPGRIQQILYNLLSNAIKFTAAGGLVEVHVELREEEICVLVRDTGIGIPEDQLPHVFERFRQLDDSMTREHSGTGLGLAISKELVTLLRGSIHVTSEVGKGSTFSVTLPVNAELSPQTSELHRVNLGS